MNARSRTFRFGADDGGPLTSMEPGDVVEQTGPRIGWRYWLVVDINHARVWSHALLLRLEGDDIVPAVIDANKGGTVWRIGLPAQ